MDAVFGSNTRCMPKTKSSAVTGTPSAQLASRRWKVQVSPSGLLSQDLATLHYFAVGPELREADDQLIDDDDLPGAIDLGRIEGRRLGAVAVEQAQIAGRADGTVTLALAARECGQHQDDQRYGGQFMDGAASLQAGRPRGGGRSVGKWNYGRRPGGRFA